MELKKISRLMYLPDLLVCTVWFMLIAHNELNRWTTNPFILLFPALRIWLSFLMRRKSKLMIAPVVMLALMMLAAIVGTEPVHHLFIKPWLTLHDSVAALFGSDGLNWDPVRRFGYYRYTVPVGLISSLWLVVCPLAVYIRLKNRKMLLPSGLNTLKAVGLSAYIFAVVTVSSIIIYENNNVVLGLSVLALMIMVIPAVFYRGNIKGIFTRGEIAYLLSVVMLVIGYVCGIGMEQKSVFTLCVLPAAFYALANWYFRRKTEYKDILLISAASIVFFCAQYTVNMSRVLLLFLSLSLMAIAVIRFAVATRKHLSSAGIYIMIALVLPVLCIGYNPYAVLEAKRGWHFDKYSYSPNGLLFVWNNDSAGLRDRYGVILPLGTYGSVELLTPSKPYCKVRKEGLWQIYDIERHELVSDEWFTDVVPCGRYVYKLKTEKGDKYLILPHNYDRYEKEQPAIISDECGVAQILDSE